jgi:hypothetical protein
MRFTFSMLFVIIVVVFFQNDKKYKKLNFVSSHTNPFRMFSTIKFQIDENYYR